MVRVQAFLKIVREYETRGFSETDSFFALPDGRDPKTGKFMKRKFSSTSTHPFSNDSPVSYDRNDFNGSLNTSGGAYQIKHDTWKETIKLATGWPSRFDADMQTRIAIYRLQYRNDSPILPRKTALGFIMEGSIEKAVSDTQLWNEWSWLPGGNPKNVKITMPELKTKFQTYIEAINK